MDVLIEIKATKMFMKVGNKVLPGDTLVTWVHQKKNALYHTYALEKMTNQLKNIRPRTRSQPWVSTNRKSRCDNERFTRYIKRNKKTRKKDIDIA